MTIVAQNAQLRIEYNGKNTWFLVDLNGDCYGYFETERKAKNAFNRHSLAANWETI